MACLFAKRYYDGHINENEMGWACRTHERDQEFVQISGR